MVSCWLRFVLKVVWIIVILLVRFNGLGVWLINMKWWCSNWEYVLCIVVVLIWCYWIWVFIFCSNKLCGNGVCWLCRWSCGLRYLRVVYLVVWWLVWLMLCKKLLLILFCVGNWLIFIFYVLRVMVLLYVSVWFGVWYLM